MSEHTHAVLQRQDNHAVITIRTEKGINVASVDFIRELDGVLDEVADSSDTRFVTVQAEGKVFLAGADIKAMANYTAEQAGAMAELGHRVLDKLENLPQVTVAAIQGAALGGGCELAMACDFRIVVKFAPLGQPEVLLGLIPGWGGTQRLPRLVPLGTARRLLFSGESIKAEQAKQIGLVDEIVNSQEDLEPLIRAFFYQVTKAGPLAIAAVKEALRTGKEIDCFADCFRRQEAREGMNAFLAKRPSAWANGSPS